MRLERPAATLADQQHRGVPDGHVGESLLTHVQPGQADRDEGVVGGFIPEDGPVEGGQNGGRVAPGEYQSPPCRAQGRSEGGGRGSVTGDVAEDHRQAAAVESHDVQEVAGEVETPLSGNVAGEDVQGGVSEGEARQETRFERLVEGCRLLLHVALLGRSAHRVGDAAGDESGCRPDRHTAERPDRGTDVPQVGDEREEQHACRRRHEQSDERPGEHRRHDDDERDRGAGDPQQRLRRAEEADRSKDHRDGGRRDEVDEDPGVAAARG